MPRLKTEPLILHGFQSWMCRRRYTQKTRKVYWLHANHWLRTHGYTEEPMDLPPLASLRANTPGARLYLTWRHAFLFPGAPIPYKGAPLPTIARAVHVPVLIILDEERVQKQLKRNARRKRGKNA